MNIYYCIILKLLKHHNSQTYISSYTHTGQLPFQGKTHHEANTGHQTAKIKNIYNSHYLHIVPSCHPNDHAAELNKVRNEKVDDVGPSSMIILQLQDKIKLEVLNNREVTDRYSPCQLLLACRKKKDDIQQWHMSMFFFLWCHIHEYKTWLVTSLSFICKDM